MQLTFGMYLDGTRWSGKQASSGELQLGPSGMLSLLETRIGLTGPTDHPAARINQYMHRLAVCDNAKAWFHASFKADGWSTAKQILAWRDELVEAGWKGETEASSSARLQALAILERANSPLSMGREDRLQEVLRQLEHISPIGIGHIFLQEAFELLPPAWQKVFTQLKGRGIIVEPSPPLNHKPRTSNLASVQAVLSGAPHAATIAEKDDSLLLIRAADEWQAAENLALWLATDAKANRDVTIICGADTDVLDQALRRHGLPQLGSSESSRWRASLQVLPLVLANAWKPVDIHRLVELLSLRMAPIPRSAANRLLEALREEPGTGGNEWAEALKAISADRKEYLLKKGGADVDAEAAAFTATLDAFLASDRYSPDSGIPEGALKERCQWVIDWLAWQIERDPMLGEAVSHAREMLKLAEGKASIPRVAVERMLDSVIGVGSSTLDRFEQAAAWEVVSHPGQITQPVNTVIWWGFTDPSPNPSIYWSESERGSLSKFGITLENSSIRRSREAQAWKQGFSHAEKHLLLFYPEQMHGEPVFHHPFWDEIHIAAVKTQPDQQEDAVIACLTRQCEKLHDKGRWQLAGRKASLQKVARGGQTTLSASHLIPKDSVALPDHLSYSQMNTMIGCPMKWVLQYHAGLRVQDSLSVPTDNAMIGTFCHRIIQELYAEPVRQWTPNDAEAKASDLYDSLIGSMASEFLVDGNEMDNRRQKTAIVKAVRQLVEAITQLGLVVEKSEEKLEGNMGGIPVVGYADLLLRDKKANPFILDMKWSGSSRYKKKEIEEGAALQLATYAWMLQSAEPKASVHGGYFMLAQGELLSDSALLKKEALDSEFSLPQIWGMGSRSWNQHFLALKGGRLQANGVNEQLLQAAQELDEDEVQQNLKSECAGQGLLYQRPPCRFCDFSILCGKDEGEA